MIVSHHGRTIELLGDAHLGKPFIPGVPLHRRGEREAMVWADFTTSLAHTTADVHVNLGDLFDRAVVAYEVILGTARAYISAAHHHPKTRFLILQGNHDVSRDLERVSAFDVFAEIVSGIANITVVREPVLIDGMLLVSFDPLTPATELIGEFDPPIDIAFGHWDVDSFGDDHNLIPTRLLAGLGVTTAYSGHVHKPDRFTRHGLEVVVGSLQPFSHGEGDLYITLSLAEAKKIAPEAIRDKCLRIVLAPGETFDLEPDCLQLTLVHAATEGETGTVTLGDFDMAALFAQAFDKAGVSAGLRATILGKYDELRV